jgi:hypothetical protein
MGIGSTSRSHPGRGRQARKSAADAPLDVDAWMGLNVRFCSDLLAAQSGQQRAMR